MLHTLKFDSATAIPAFASTRRFRFSLFLTQCSERQKHNSHRMRCVASVNVSAQGQSAQLFICLCGNAKRDAYGVKPLRNASTEIGRAPVWESGWSNHGWQHQQRSRGCWRFRGAPSDGARCPGPCSGRKPRCGDGAASTTSQSPTQSPWKRT